MDGGGMMIWHPIKWRHGEVGEEDDIIHHCFKGCALFENPPSTLCTQGRCTCSILDRFVRQPPERSFINCIGLHYGNRNEEG